MTEHSDTRFRVHCQSCGPLRLRGGDVTIRFAPDSSPSYRFRCPDCGLLHIEPAQPQAVAAIIEAEVGCFRDALVDDSAVAAALRATAARVRPPTDR